MLIEIAVGSKFQAACFAIEPILSDESRRHAKDLEGQITQQVDKNNIVKAVAETRPEKGEDESQRETNMVVQDWEEKIAEHLLLNACSFRGACINVE